MFKKSFTKHLISPKRVLYIAIILFILYFTFVAFSRHDNFYSRKIDLGNMDQTVWNVLHGNGFTLTDPMGTRQQSRLAVHADFLLILLAPFYLIWSNPKMLILIQTIILGLGAIPVFWITHDVLKSKKLALMFSIVYLLYPPMERLLLHDFHAITLSATFLLFAYWYMTREQYVGFILCSLLAAFGKEDVWLIIAFFGVYIVLVNKKYLIGSIIVLVSLLVFYLLFWIAIPAVTDTKQHFALIYLSNYGGNLNDIAKNILRNPLSVIHTMIMPDRLWYYVQLLVPVGLLPIASLPHLVFAFPSLFINVISDNTLMRQINYQYNSTIAPFIFIASIYGYKTIAAILHRFSRTMPVLRRIPLALWICFCAVGSVVAWGELPFGKNARFSYFTTPPLEKAVMEHVERLVPSSKSLSVTNNIGSHFSQRQFVYNYPVNAQIADYTVVYLGDAYAWPSAEAQKNMLDSLLKNSAYKLFAQKGNFYAFRRIGL